ncbi:MAG: hypothetical protein DRI57_15945 [Deltaproteobacteria bacterium]|nr:MAG: hypothetical protein DRI57_15945 [Deltaproteobacteria bacterium]
MLTCHDVAKYFLSLTDENLGDLISNLKLQKLVYYAQGFHLAIHDTPLFNEDIEAWVYGPVIPELYYGYKKYGPGHIPSPKDMDFSVFDEEIRSLLDEVYTVFGQYSAWKLANMTHEEPTWRDTAECGIITHNSMREYFKTLLTNE